MNLYFKVCYVSCVLFVIVIARNSSEIASRQMDCNTRAKIFTITRRFMNRNETWKQISFAK